MKNGSKSLILRDFLPYRLSVLSNRISAAIAALYEGRFGLSLPEWRVMAVLGEEPGLSAAEVADKTAMDKVAVSRAVKSLRDSGRLTRTVADDDRRRSVLTLTPAGQAVYEEVVPLAIEYEDHLESALSATELTALDALIEKLTAAQRALD